MQEEQIFKITSKLNFKTQKINSKFKLKILEIIMSSFDFDTKERLIKRQSKDK